MKKLDSLKIKYILLRRAFGVIDKVVKNYVLIQLVGSIAGGISPYVTLYFTSLIIDELSGDKNINRLILFVLLTLSFALLLNGIAIYAKHFCDCRNRIIWNGQTLELNEKILDMDYEYIEEADIQNRRRALGDIMNFINGGGIIGVYYAIPILVSNLAGLLCAVFFIFKAVSAGIGNSDGNTKYILISLTFLLFIMLFIIVFIMYKLTLKSKKFEFEISQQFYETNRVGSFYINDYLTKHSSGKDIRIFRQYPLLKKGYDDFVNKIRTMENSLSKDETRVNGINGGLTALIGSLIYLFFGFQALYGLLSIGSVVLYAGSAIKFINCYTEVLTQITKINVSCNYLKPYFEFIDIRNEKEKNGLPVENEKIDIEFQNVSFKYPKTEAFVLKDISIKIRHGKRLAIVGKNGSGKTTFIKLLCRLYDVTEGNILLNGKNIKEYDYEEFMDTYGIVFQDFNLISSSLAKNVSASEKFDREMVRECIEKAGLGKRITELEKGIDSVLYKNFDPDGIEISGGEAQKVAIARALYKDALFIVMDEPTAALDPISEYEIFTKFNMLVENKTAVYISHRLSSCRFCDEIIVFDEGRIVQRGTHEELVQNKDGLYNELWNAQANYYA